MTSLDKQTDFPPPYTARRDKPVRNFSHAHPDTGLLYALPPQSGVCARVSEGGAEGTSRSGSGAHFGSSCDRVSGRLGNTRITFPVSKARLQARDERWQLRGKLVEISGIERVRKCGRVTIAPFVTLKASESREKVAYSGLHTCGSVWACPVCSAKIAARRREELDQVVDRAVAEGLYVSMLTLTQRHHTGQSLPELWDALSTAWNRVTSGRRWQKFKEQLGLVGYVRANEVTYGAHGWHVHTHVLLISKRDPRTTPIVYQRKQGRRKRPYDPEVYFPHQFIAERWQAGLAKCGIDFIADRGGLDWQVAQAGDAVALGRYVGKLTMNSSESIVNEATLGSFKRARGENRTPFQILADIAETGNPEDIALWHAWENGSRGRKALLWSKGLRDWARLGREATDEEIAQEEVEGSVVARFSIESWKQLYEIGAVDAINILQGEGEAALYEWLKENRIEFFKGDEYPPPDDVGS